MIDQREVEKKLNSLFVPPRRHRNRAIWATVSLAAAAILALPAAYWVDTGLFPVVSRAHALIFEQAAPGETLVSFVYEKLRACRIVSAGFFLNGASIRPVEVIDNINYVIRPLGTNRSRLFRLKVDREEFIEHGVVQFVHQCHIGWYHQRVVFD